MQRLEKCDKFQGEKQDTHTQTHQPLDDPMLYQTRF